MTMRSILHPASRFLLAFIFLASGAGKVFAFDQTAAMMTSVGFPIPTFFLVGAILIELLAGLGLLLGLGTRYSAAALIVFVVPATIMFHASFIGDPVTEQEQVVNTLKNIAIIGGLLKFVADGGGYFSLDNRFAKREIVI
jgi:putative oxidoreductase